MVSKKKSGSKQKKSDGESSKRHPARQPESGGGRGVQVVQVEEEHGRVDSTSPSVKITKSGSEKEEEEEEAEELLVENKKTGQNVVEGSSGSVKPPLGKVQVAKSGKGKRLKNEIDEPKVESPSVISAGYAPSRQLRPRKQPAVFQEVSKGEVNDALLSRIIGKKIQVYWPLDSKWYSGQVRSFDEKTNRHHVIYDDGEQERLELMKERIKIQVEPGQVAGETAEVSNAQPEDYKDIEMKEMKEMKEGNNKTSVNNKEEGDIVDGGKKNGMKRKQGKKNGRKGKDEEEETVGKKVEMEVEMMSTDVDDSKKKNEEQEENVNKKKEETVDEGQGQVVEEVHNHKRPKTSKQTAPRTKRGGSRKKIVQEHVVEDHTEGIDGKQESKEPSHHVVQDIKPDEDARATEYTTLEKVSMVEVDSVAKLIETNANTFATEKHIDDQKPAEIQVLEQAEEDEQTADSGDKPKMANQMEEKCIDARGGDGKVTEKKIDTKDTDQVSKKHTNKKHHGRAKARESVRK